MAHHAICLEPEEFLEILLRPQSPPTDPDPSPPQWTPDIFKTLEDAKKMTEAEISARFIAAVNNHDVAHGLKLSESQDRPDIGEITGQKIDAAFFRPQYVPTDARPNWADQLVCVEFKSHDTGNDPYDDRPKEKVEAEAKSRKRVRGQIISYSEKIFEYQHRTALYMLLIIGRRFRILRWDRSGTVVTRAVDYVEHPEVLCEMLWRISRMSDVDLGLDPSATRVRPGDDDYTLMNTLAFPDDTDVNHTEGRMRDDEFLKDGFVFEYVRELFRNSVNAHFPRYRLKVPDGERGMREFLVGKPAFQAPGMAGRGTRGYVAFDCDRRRFAWLKDAWRPYYELVDQEGTTLAKLNAEGVRNVPTLVCHGDILEQTTKTPQIWDFKNPPLPPNPPPRPTITHPLATSVPPRSHPSSSDTLVAPPPSTPPRKTLKRSFSEVEEEDEDSQETHLNDCPLRRHMHYRIVVQEVALNLKNFQYAEQLVSVVQDCVTAHADAMSKADVIHRDVSAGNILIFPRVRHKGTRRLIKWTGLLTDWELSKPISQTTAKSRARQPERTGTWQFMSAAALSDHAKPIETSDELESFFYVVLYNAVRYLRSNCSDVGMFIEGFFDTYVVRNKVYSCGVDKNLAITQGMIVVDGGSEELRFDSPLDEFFRKALSWFKAKYKVEAYRKKQAIAAARPAVAQPRNASPTRESAAGGVLPQTRPRDLDDLYDDDGDDDDSNNSDADGRPGDEGQSQTPANTKPTDAEEAEAKLVTTHKAMLNALSATLKSRNWGDSRVVGDNVPANYHPFREVGPTRGAGIRAVKRLRSSRALKTVPNYPFSSGNEPRTPDHQIFKTYY